MVYQRITIAATFTSELVEDFLSYWLEQLGISDPVEFAPYNQIFQELLNPTSLFAQNQNGINLILLRLEDWESNKQRLGLTVDRSRAQEFFGESDRYTLPNHLEIAHLNQYETEYLYQEIFGDRVYLRHGIVFNEDDCIIDVGANIGLFTLFAQQQCPQGTIYAFEPAPHAFEKLEINAKLYCQNVHLFNCGLGAENKQETFTFYPRSSVFSSFAADTEQDEKAIRSVILNILRRDDTLDEETLEVLADEFLKDRLDRHIYQAQLRSLSEIIEEYQIERIDLLKLDAEKSELAIIQGIKEHHWALIKQIVIEVHDQEGSTIAAVMDLLTAKGFEFAIDQESLLQGSGLYNIYAIRPSQQNSPKSSLVTASTSQIEQNIRDLGSALKTAISRSANPHLVSICPPSPRVSNGGFDRDRYQRMEALLAAEINDINGVYLVKSTELMSVYPVENYYDAYGDEFGHIPYTPEFFGGLGTMLARKICALKSDPYKVIVLDCDNTLWSGVCGEDGVTGVTISSPYRALQAFIIAQQQAGKLICLCSKNQPEDVFAIFDEHQDMLLKREYLVSSCINWQPKSVNLKVLAAELQLGLDSFVFIDDNPVECAEVRANCPEVLTLQLPTECDRIPQFLEHIWAFDQLNITQTDRQRTELYQQNIHRQQLQENTLTFNDFISQLGLEIEISPPQASELPRVAQLTQRTNQFNFTTIRRSEIEIQQLSDTGKLESRVVRVKDRFGDYGLVGLILFETQGNAICVDTFLLSCRVLGRGVEHKMLAELGAIAQIRGLNSVEVAYLPTRRNQPAGNFLASIGREFKLDFSDDRKLDRSEFKFPSLSLAKLTFAAIDDVNAVSNQQTEQPVLASNIPVKTYLRSQLFTDIANKLYNPKLIFAEITAHQQRQRSELDLKFVSPHTPLETAVASLFATVLKLDRVGIDDNFFELGGDSIRGAILINKLQAQLNEIVHFVVLFDTKTVAKLAGYLEENYPQSVAKLLGQEKAIERQVPHQRIELAQVMQMRSLIPPLAPTIDDGTKNPRAIFMLSPHRSGSTLLRVILGGNPQLFAPPELELLSFNTLQERTTKLSGRYSFWLEGTIRTIMQIRGCQAEEAIALMEELTANNITTKQFYQLIQGWLGDKILVDKTPSYSINLATLKRAERDFDNPLYIHLARHPYATIRSYEEARVDQTFPYKHPFERRELAELVWTISHQNILEFLGQIPAERQYQLKFEDLVKTPQTSVGSLCQFLGVEFHADMLQPYQEKQQRMTDGIYAQSRMIGDVKFHEHQGINANTADSWRQDYTVDFLGDVTWQVAASLGYDRNRGAIPQVKRQNSPTFPLSFAQQRLWVLAQLEPDSPFYNMFKAVRLHGRIDVEILERSFNEIIRRHEILRTNFQMVAEGTPVQVIAPTAQIKLSVVDFQGLSEPQQSAQLQLVATESQLQPFALTEGLLFRVTLVQLQPESYALLLTMHHIIGDGWSMGVITAELSSIYQNCLLGAPSTLPELPIQYVDFTIWQRQRLRGAAFQTQINYWQQQLAAAPPLLELPTDRARPSVQTFRGGCHTFELTPQLTKDLQALSHKSDTTMFMTLMAAYAVLLHRHSGQTDILVGTPIASRNHQDIEPLIGFFVNTLVLRTQVAGNFSYAELLGQVRSTCMDAYGHQDVPFEQIIETLNIERSLSHTPLFQVVFALQNTPLEQLTTSDLAIEPLQLDNVNAKCDLTLQMWETDTAAGNALAGFWQYNTDLFDRSRIERMSGHFQTLLAGIVANPSQQISQLPLLTAVEQQQLLVEWNDTQVDYPQDKYINSWFEEQVARTPDAVAVVYEHQQLTYSELNCRANQLAHYLRSLGVGADVLVGICVERSLEMIVGLLGILKAGGAYVPLDPEYPTERITYMLEDSQLSILLTQARLLVQLPEHMGTTICLDRDWSVIAQHTTANPIPAVQPYHLAYIIYTSGSTGTPKGVMIEHRSLLNQVLTTNRKYGFTANDKILQFASICFDASVLEIFPGLVVGATLVLRTEEMLDRHEVFWQRCQAWQLTVLILSTAYWQQLVAELTPQDSRLAQHVRMVTIGGEAVQRSKVEHWYDSIAHLPDPICLFNVYGPTEATVQATFYEFSSLATDVLIGKPLGNTQVYILDRYLQPVPIGVAGELHIGGAGLARGYLNRPELTTAKFIPNPWGTQPNSRLYKTGDLARYLPDGNIEYLGRIDNQVKIRGFRIELGEIETVLSQHGDIQSSVVIALEDTPGDKRLVAYIIPQLKQTPITSELRQFLKTQLPEYMVPNAFVILDSLPLTPNGKVDRHALPAPELNSGLSAKYIAPRTPVEEILTLIWAQVLKVPQVGIEDNFFELGGHSLLATQLISRIRTNFQVELPLRSLFAAPTVAELAQSIHYLQQENLELTAPPIVATPRTGTLPLSFAQTRLWFLDQLETNSAFYHIPMAMRLVGTLNRVALAQSLGEIINRHEILRTNFITIEGEPVQIIQPELAWQLETIDRQQLPSTEAEISCQELISTYGQQPFDLATEPLIRATLVLLSETEHILLVCMHHIISDGWSMGVLAKELALLYAAYSQDQPSPLELMPVQYADFALWQRQWFQGEILDNQLAYWQQQLATAPQFLPLPTDRPRPAVQRFQGARHAFALSPELSQGLIQLSQQQGVTLFMTLLAAFDTLLYRYTGQAEILVGSPIANRNRREIEGLIGFFVNTLVLRTDLSGNPSFSELLVRVREMALGTYAHQDLPFEMLVEVLQPQRDLSHTPLFQVMFVLQNAPTAAMELTGLTMSPVVPQSGTAKFDLTLVMENTPGGLVGVWNYNTDLFDRWTIERMNGHFGTVLSGIVANPEERISQLPILTAVEQQQLLVEWSGTEVDYPQDKCIHHLFEAQVGRTPDAVAVVFEHQQLTYAELNVRANQLAHYLQSLGVEPDVLVGICVERSLEMIVGLLGILKAGGAYVPLDPEYPTERSRFILEDAQVDLLLSQQHLAEKLPEHQARVVYLDTNWSKIADNSESNPLNGATSINLAYVIYTSGSTGQPKGVLVNHANVVRLFAATADWYHFADALRSGFPTRQAHQADEQDVWTLFHSYAFDFSVWEIWGALLYGGRLVVVPYLVTRSPESFYQLLCQEKVTILNQTPSAFRQLILAEQSLGTAEDLKLRLVIFGGEALEVASLQPWFDRHGDQSPQLVNMYGITETTVHVTYRPLSQGDVHSTANVIGRPIPDLQVYVLDQQLQPVPIGVPGEMYIGGAGVTCGYLNRPELTAGRFIANPFYSGNLPTPSPSKAGSRSERLLYKSGDLARYLPNGELEYLGRIDDQVKIRGFRIELGEIEAVLARHPTVRESVVVVREDESGDKRLVAHVVPQIEQSAQVGELRQFLKTKLPDYMVPNAIVILESLPLTPSGKIDRRALPVPDSQLELFDKYVAPGTPIEAMLVQIWAQVLKVEQVGIHDNFFELGGHSLLATQLFSRIRSDFQVEVPLRSLFAGATVAELGRSIQDLQHQNLKLTVTPILPRKRNARSSD